MINQVVYDVFIKGDDDDENAQGLRGVSRFNEDLASFTEKGLQFRYGRVCVLLTRLCDGWRGGWGVLVPCMAVVVMHGRMIVV